MYAHHQPRSRRLQRRGSYPYMVAGFTRVRPQPTRTRTRTRTGIYPNPRRVYLTRIFP